MANLGKIVYLTEAQKNTLFTNGSVTSGNVTIQYSDNDLYVTTDTISKADVGLGNVDNTSDLNKPVSTAQQTAIDAVAATVVTVPGTGAGSVQTKGYSYTPQGANYQVDSVQQATGIGAFAEGSGTNASGSCAHAEGAGTIASGNNSHAEGFYTLANSNCQHVSGKWNIIDLNQNVALDGTYAEIVGNGTADSARSNARTLDWSGNGWYAGTLTCNTSLTIGNTTMTELQLQTLLSIAQAAGVSF